MSIANRGAKALHEKLAAWGYPGELDSDTLMLTNRGVIIHFPYVYDELQAKSGYASYVSHTYVPTIRQTVQDVIIGIDPTRRNPHGAAADAYLSSVFPLVHSLFCGDHDAMNVMAETVYAVDRETGLPREWSLLLGPERNMNVPVSDAGQRRFADALADLYEPMLADPGVYWFRCFAGRMAGSPPSADCFLNNRPYSEGERRFVDIGRSLPGSDKLLSCKQQFVLVPKDLDEGLSVERERWREQWVACVGRHEPTLDSRLRDKVFLCIEGFAALQGFHESHVERWLKSEGCSSDEAWRLTAFVPEACARVQWRPEGARFCDIYIRLNPDTGKGQSGMLSKEPLFVATERVVRAMREDGHANSTLDSILENSAPHNTMRQVTEAGRRPADVMELHSAFLAYDDIDGEIAPEHLAKFREMFGKSFGKKKPWWKFW